MKRFVLACVALAFMTSVTPVTPVRAAALESCDPPKTCRLNLNCDFLSLCAYCNGATEGDKGTCGGYGE
jgi:hypothetical protein